MTGINLGKNGKFGNIDFNKLISGITKEDLGIQDNSVLASIFDSINTNTDGTSKNKLDRNELVKFISAVIALSGDDQTLSANEARKFQIKGENLGKNKEELFNFLNKLSELTKGIENVQQKENSEVIRYENGHTVEIFNDGRKKECFLKDNKNYTVEYDKNGTLTHQIIKDENEEVLMSFENDKLKTKSIDTDSESITIRYENGKEQSKTVTNKSDNIVKEYEMLNGEYVLVIETDNKNKTETVHYEDKIVITKQTDDGQKIEIQDKDNNLKETTITKKREDGIIENTHTEYNETGYVEVVSAGGYRLSQTKEIDGTTYSIQYDGKGNTTGIIVQNGESLSSIAKKFNCDRIELARVNASKLKGKHPNNYFLVGTEILIPKELEADDPALQNRLTREGAIDQYKQQQAELERQRLIEEAARQAEEAALDQQLEDAGCINREGKGTQITIGGKTYIQEGKGEKGRIIARDEEDNIVVISHDKKILNEEYIKREQSIKVNENSAKDIIDRLENATKGRNDQEALKNILLEIDNSGELALVEKHLSEKGYGKDPLYSPLEKFIHKEFKNPDAVIEDFINGSVANGTLEGVYAASAQARLACRVICKACDGWGTDCKELKEGVRLIKDPTGNDPKLAMSVYKYVQIVVKNHSGKEFESYLKGEIWNYEIDYLNGILAENDALQGKERINAVSELTREAVSGAGTDIPYLKQAIKGITPEDRVEIEKKLRDEYCKDKNVKGEYPGQWVLQAIMYDECDTFLGLNRDHKEIRKFNEMLIAQGAYTKHQTKILRAEQAALQIFEGDFKNIQDALEHVKDGDVLKEIDKILEKLGYNEGLFNYIESKLDKVQINLVLADLASKNLLDDKTAAEVAYSLLTSESKYRSIAIKAITNENVANKVNEKLIGSGYKPLDEFYGQIQANKKDKKNIKEMSEVLYLEATSPSQIPENEKSGYETTISVFEENLEALKKGYEDFKHGVVTTATNEICELFGIGTTKEDVEEMIAYNTETLRLLKLAKDGKLKKSVNGVMKNVTFKEVFEARQANKLLPGKNKKVETPDIDYDASAIENVSKQSERMFAMQQVNDLVLGCWDDCIKAENCSDIKLLSEYANNIINKLKELAPNTQNYTCKFSANGVLLNPEGRELDATELKNLISELKKSLEFLIKKSYEDETIDLSNCNNALALKDLLDSKYNQKMESFKDEYEKAFGERPSDEVIENYIKTSNTGKTVLHVAAMVGAGVIATVFAPFSGGTSVALFVGAVAATTSFGLNALEHSTDSDGYTADELNDDVVQSLWDGLLTASGVKVGSLAAGYAMSASAINTTKNIKLVKFITGNSDKMKSALAEAVVRAEAAGIEITSDVLLSTVQTYCQEGEFNEETFIRDFVISLLSNGMGNALPSGKGSKSSTPVEEKSIVPVEQSETPILDKAVHSEKTPSGADIQPSSSVKLGEQKTAAVEQEVKAALETPKGPAELGEFGKKVKPIQNRDLRRELEREIDKNAKNLSSAEKQEYDNQKYQEAKTKVEEHLNRKKRLKDSDMKDIHDYINLETDTELIDDIVKRVRNYTDDSQKKNLTTVVRNRKKALKKMNKPEVENKNLADTPEATSVKPDAEPSKTEVDVEDVDGSVDAEPSKTEVDVEDVDGSVDAEPSKTEVDAEGVNPSSSTKSTLKERVAKIFTSFNGLRSAPQGIASFAQNARNAVGNLTQKATNTVKNAFNSSNKSRVPEASSKSATSQSAQSPAVETQPTSNKYGFIEQMRRNREARRLKRKERSESVKTYKDGTVRIVTKDRKGNCTKVVLKDTSGEVTRSYDFTYDSKGNRIKEVWKDADGNVTRSYDFTYDSNGNKIKEVVTYTDASREVTESIVYKYDRKGKVTESWEYTSDSNGNHTEGVFKNAEGDMISSYEYKYDSNGIKTETVYKNAKGDEITYDEWLKL